MRGFSLYTRLREQTDGAEQVLSENELAANAFSAKVLIACWMLSLLCLLFNTAGIFQAPMHSQLVSVIITTVAALGPAFYTLRHKGGGKYVKLLLMTGVTIACAGNYMVLTYNVIILIFLPVALSVSYYSVKLTYYTGLITILLFGLAAVFSTLGAAQPDLNSVRLSDTSLAVAGSLRSAVVEHGFDITVYRTNTILRSFLPIAVVFLLPWGLSILAAGKGRKLVLSQDIFSRRAARMETELSLAADIQNSLLPPADFEEKNIILHAAMHPAREVGGDLYDYFLTDEKHLALVIADVSGKGVPAAMITMTVKKLMKSCLTSGLSPAKTLAAVNATMCDGNESGMFATAWTGVVDLDTKVLTYANAGHNSPALELRGDLHMLEMDPGIMLGLFEDAEFTEDSIRMEKGDKLLLYTDGVTEAENASRKLFGPDRLLTVLREGIEQPEKDILGWLQKRLMDFTGGYEQSDDITMLYMEFK